MQKLKTQAMVFAVEAVATGLVLLIAKGIYRCLNS